MCQTQEEEIVSLILFSNEIGQVFIPIVNKKVKNRMRASVDLNNKSSLSNIFSKIPAGIKAKEKFKSKLKLSSSIGPQQNAGPFLKSLTNVKSKLKVNFKETFKKIVPKRTLTIHSEDEFSDHSSDLDFAEKHRIYNKLQKIGEPLMQKINQNFLGNLNKHTRRENDMNPCEVEEESTIQWSIFKNKRSQTKPKKILKPIERSTKRRKFKMKNLIDNFNIGGNRYVGNSTNTISDVMPTYLPSISIVPLKNIAHKGLTQEVLRAAVSKKHHFKSIQ